MGRLAMSSDDREDEGAPAKGGLGRAGHEPTSSLPRPLQEHLAQQLRSAYHELSDKPSFLGDPTLPVEFEYHLARLEAVERNRLIERIRREGLEAVRSALEEIVARPLGTDPRDPGKRNGN
jgi:hypothetical protein